MAETVDFEETSLTHRVVLIGLVELTAAGETPAHAGEVRGVCTADLDAIEGDVVGTLTEAEVSRAFNELESDGLVEATRDDTSATGKGRPRYDLAVDSESITAAFDDDERVRPLLESLSA